MNVLPSAVIAARTAPKLPAALPMPIRSLGGGSAAAPAPKMEILPPAILSARPIGAAPTRDTIELVSDPPGKKPRGRPSKKEKAREARAAASASIAALLESDPKKADIREYFENRVKELCDL